ncbi:MAG: GAF domain-containing protein [Holophagaceae bacterium]|nr:GAF domain-containing protein [Holophagaceae bacterium]
MRFTVAMPPEHRNTLQERLGRELRSAMEWKDQGPADVVVGVEGAGALAECAAWPGQEGALALIQAGYERIRDRARMGRLNEVGRALASEQNLDRLLDLILSQGRELLRAEAGSIYLVDDGGKELIFAHTQNSKLDMPYHRFRMPVTMSTLAGFVAATGESLNIPDVYAIPGDSPYSFSDYFDRQSGYHTQSMLVVPMTDNEGKVLGVLQFINRVWEDGAQHGVVPFQPEHQNLAQSLAGQAGVAVKNAALRQEIELLFEGFVNASVTAIESRDPVTSGHSSRVASLTVGLAEAINATPNGLYGETFFTERQLREIRYASLLHDFGKVGVREQVLVKAKKLDPLKLELILQRLRQRDLEQALALLSESWKGGEHFDPATWESIIRDRQTETDRLIALVRQSDMPTVLPEEIADGLGLVGELEFTHWSGERRQLVERSDLNCLRIRKGSLSDSERLEIESHVTHTFRFLKQIPWTRDLEGVPEIAFAHHEKLGGRGYPRGLQAPAIPVQSRAMTISDIFDALTAQDRPYKLAVPLSKSLNILNEEANDGNVDRVLLDLFIEARIFERTAKT